MPSIISGTSVLGYNFSTAKRLLAQLGQKDASWQDLLSPDGHKRIVVLALTATCSAPSARERDPALQAYEKFCAFGEAEITRNPKSRSRWIGKSGNGGGTIWRRQSKIAVHIPGCVMAQGMLQHWTI
jgi:hypothetical protein